PVLLHQLLLGAAPGNAGLSDHQGTLSGAEGGMAMSSLIDGLNRFLHSDVEVTSRALVVLAALLMIPVYLLPLWQLTMFAPQYPQGLRLNIYSYKLDGGNRGQDVKEVNVLNHYIGMKELTTEAFTEFKWIPFVVGAMGLLFLRSVVHGQMHALV